MYVKIKGRSDGGADTAEADCGKSQTYLQQSGYGSTVLTSNSLDANPAIIYESTFVAVYAKPTAEHAFRRTLLTHSRSRLERLSNRQ